MIIGDVLLVFLMSFYAGIGIWESGSLRHILAMILPAVAVWFIAAQIFKLYSSFPKEIVPAPLKELPRLIDKLIAWQKPFKLLAVWVITGLTACLWQAFYWRHILKSPTYSYRFGIQTVIWYLTSYAVFFAVWRFVFTGLITLVYWTKEVRSIRIVMLSIAGLAVLYFAAAMAINLHYRPLKYTVDTVPEGAPRTALVFGAGIYLNGTPSAVLVDRVATAVELYQKGLIDEMIMSGDNSDGSRNEVDAMAKLAADAGVPEDAILHDNAGVHTAESCWNAKNVFGKDEVIFISQDFHNTRIMMTAKSYGLNGIAVRADRRIYNIFSWGIWYLLDWLRLPIYFVHYR